jgi:hypothetical protein
MTTDRAESFSVDRDDVRRVLAGDPDAFAPLVRRHEARVRALCASLLKDPTDAEDAAQESFLKAYRHLGGFRGRERPFPPGFTASPTATASTRKKRVAGARPNPWTRCWKKATVSWGV